MRQGSEVAAALLICQACGERTVASSATAEVAGHLAPASCPGCGSSRLLRIAARGELPAASVPAGCDLDTVCM